MTPKYRLTVEIAGNSHEEIEDELFSIGSSYYSDSDGYTRDEFRFIGANSIRTLEHINPDVTVTNIHDWLLTKTNEEYEEFIWGDNES